MRQLANSFLGMVHIATADISSNLFTPRKDRPTIRRSTGPMQRTVCALADEAFRMHRLRIHDHRVLTTETAVGAACAY